MSSMGHELFFSVMVFNSDWLIHDVFLHPYALAMGTYETNAQN